MAAAKLRTAQRVRIPIMLAAGLSTREVARLMHCSQPNVMYYARKSRRASRIQLEAAAAIQPSGEANGDRAI
jgi:predicted transcriptional regulator